MQVLVTVNEIGYEIDVFENSELNEAIINEDPVLTECRDTENHGRVNEIVNELIESTRKICEN